MSTFINLQNVRVHNLQGINLELPKHKLVGFCGPSGSGKSSLAINTLFAEGQRRYLDTFSTTERGLLQQPDKPDADLIDGVPPAIAITRSNELLNSRVTVGTMTELLYYFQLVYTRLGTFHCKDCGVLTRRDSPDSIARFISSELQETQVTIGFSWSPSTKHPDLPHPSSLVANGFQRAIFKDRVQRIDSLAGDPPCLDVLVDRILVKPGKDRRIQESVETAFRYGSQSCFVVWETPLNDFPACQPRVVDEREHAQRNFFAGLNCPSCNSTFEPLEPNQLSYNSPVGACATCQGIGRHDEFLPSRLIENTNLTLNGGLFPVLERPEMSGLKSELIQREILDPNTPYCNFDPDQQKQILADVMEFLETSLPACSSKIAKLLSSLKGKVNCRQCLGARFNPNALSYHFAGRGFDQIVSDPVEATACWFKRLPRNTFGTAFGFLFDEIQSRLQYLCDVGVGYLSPIREVNTLSTGERQRVCMTNALGSNLVNMLYVFDEPCSGLHPADVPLLIHSLHSLTRRGNTVVAVDHDLDLIQSADFVTEFGPGAGVYGGQVTYSGPPAGISSAPGSITGDYLAGRRGFYSDESKRPPKKGQIKLINASGNNLDHITVEFPLSLLCVVTGVSGSGKSSLVVDTLYPAIARRKKQQVEPCLPFDDVHGIGAIDDVLLVDQAPIGQTSRSNPATFSKAFDAIRNVFAETIDARARNIKAGRFSFNTDGGRCDACKGEGTKQIDMQFLANLHVRCKFCKGTRYKQDVLNCRYRGRNISDVLNMTTREAFSFFRGQKKVQAKLKPMMDVGLDYLRLGQPASTLSSGESQRLRLAGFLSSGRKARTLFILDEPTVGLHYGDVVKLLDCFDSLLDEGHSIIIVEHNQMMMHAADYLIDLGPGAGQQGGKVIASGSPSEVARCQESKTGRVLATTTQRV